jgi:hypothetical protein
MLMMSLNQYPKTVQLVHVCICGGVTSRSTLDQVPGGAQLDSCLGKIHPSVLDLFFTEAFVLLKIANIILTLPQSALKRTQSMETYNRTRSDILYGLVTYIGIRVPKHSALRSCWV